MRNIIKTVLGGKKIFLTLMITMLIGLPTLAIAADFKANESGNTTITKDEKLKNLYTVGSSISNDADITGDMAAAASDININGNVENSLFAAGSTITIKGNVGHTARIVGSTIIIDGKIQDDLFAAGNVIDINKSSLIAGDLILGGNTININADVDGKLWAAADKLTINSRIKGNVVLKNVQTLVLGDNAVIDGNLTYYSPNQATIASSATISGKVIYNQVSAASKGVAGIMTLAFLYKIITAFILGLVLMFGVGRFTKESMSNVTTKFWTNIGWGLISLIILPIAAILLLVSIIGIKLAVIIGLIYTLVILLASILLPVIIGSFSVGFIKKDKEYPLSWTTVLIGAIIAAILSIIPILGGTILFIILLAIIGSMFQTLFRAIKNWGK
ncbi:MAG: hypothetical protein WCW17_02585 [Patescibacteria group bacterium]